MQASLPLKNKFARMKNPLIQNVETLSSEGREGNGVVLQGTRKKEVLPHCNQLFDKQYILYPKRTVLEKEGQP